MKPIAWYDPTNGAVSRDKDSPLFTPLGQVWPLYPQSEQEPVAWNVVDPTGKIVATEMNSVRGWARIEGYKPTVEGLLGFHEQGWRVVPTTPPQRTWVGLTEDEILLISADCAATHQHTDIHFARAIEAALKAKNT